jgi:hypothetical protein
MAKPSQRQDCRIAADDTELFGKFIKTWATGRNYVEPHADPIPLPTTKYPKPNSFAELINQCAAMGLYFRYDDTAHTRVEAGDDIQLNFAATNADVWTIRLSAVEFIDKSEAYLIKDGASYPLHAYDDVFYDARLKDTVNGTAAARMALHELRIGEYTISTCF